MKLILASQSPYRKALLTNFGLKFETSAPQVDEEILKRNGPADLEELTRYLAAKKAESLTGLYDNAIILGSDQIAELSGRRLDKPGTKEKAFEQLKAMSGKSHRLITSLAVISPLKNTLVTNVTTIRLRTLSDEDIRAYVELDNPIDCAGSYKIEKAGLALVDSVQTDDPSAIQGLPMIALTRTLQEHGLHLTQFWSS